MYCKLLYDTVSYDLMILVWIQGILQIWTYKENVQVKLDMILFSKANPLSGQKGQMRPWLAVKQATVTFSLSAP